MNMTPERIEEIKREAQKESETIYGNCSANITNIELLGLLAALEESQQELECFRAKTEPESLGYGAKWKQKALAARTKLMEAQQTIARQQERERSIIYEVSEIHKEATAGNSGTLDRADTALNRIMLLSSNLLALGNKEGTAVPVTPNCPTCGNQHPIDHPSRPGIYLCVPCDYVYEEGSDKA